MQIQSGREKKAPDGGKKLHLLGMQMSPARFYANKRWAKHFNVFLSCYSRAKSF